MQTGLYAAYFTGAGGSNVALLYIGNGAFVGIDGNTNKYDGSYRLDAENRLLCRVTYRIPSGAPLVTGNVLDEDTTIELEFILPERFWEQDIIRIETPTGAVNMRFEKMRDLQ